MNIAGLEVGAIRRAQPQPAQTDPRLERWELELRHRVPFAPSSAGVTLQGTLDDFITLASEVFREIIAAAEDRLERLASAEAQEVDG